MGRESIGERSAERSIKGGGDRRVPGGLAGWLLRRLRGGRRPQPRLALVERIALAPRQSLALVEAEGRRILVATSADGGPAFYPLDERARLELRGIPTRSAGTRGAASRVADRSSRVSW
jgi:hypothetical protein